MVKTVTLTAGTPQAVTFSEAYPFYWIDNKTSGEVYASVGGTPEPGKDGTYTIAAGSQLRISGGDFNGGIVLLGEGRVQVVASGIAACPFKSAPVSGGGEVGDADTVNGHTVEADVPADAVFTDTVYDDTDIREDISNCVKTDDSRLSDARTPTAHTHDDRYYTEAEIDAMLDEKAGKDVATQSADGLMSAEDKVKLDEADNTYASKALYDDTTINIGRKAGTTVGIHSTAEGSSTTASGNYSHAEGSSTTASGNYSHAEGSSTTASGTSSHAEGSGAKASGNYSHAEGTSTTASGYNSHAEGNYTTASGSYSHAEGSNKSADDVNYVDRTVTISDVDYTIKGCTAYGINSHAEGTQTFAYGYTSHAEGRSTTASGTNSHAEGYNTTASGSYSHAEGYNTTASGSYSHAEGNTTTASGGSSHAEGISTTASTTGSHAEGQNTTASGGSSHAEGSWTTASGSYSHAGGTSTTASNYASHASGHCNAAMTDGGNFTNTTGTAFVIGNGTSSTALSNAFSVQFDGKVKAKSTITASTTADYAEFFEWLDGNPDDEDRIGYFVTLDGDKIRIAAAADDYVLGVVSGEPFVLGNGDCDTWNGMFLRDEFRRTIFEPAPKMAEILDSEGNPTGEFEEVEGEFEGTRPKLNPEYDHTQKYISRFDRKEWAPVGMLGVLAVRHDETAVVNGYVTVNADGIATACEKSAENAYRVIKSNTDSVVEIIFR